MGAYLLRKGYEMSIIEIPFSRFKQDPKFEYDPNKSAANLEKHGIDFEQAQELWKDGAALRVEVSYEGEERFILIGMIGGKHWTAVITYREKRIRIISVRRSRKQEVNRYEQKD